MINKKKSSSQRKLTDSDYFDDCAVCQFMKDAEQGKKEHSLSELNNAFKKEKEKGAVVGGTLDPTKSKYGSN